MKAFFKTVSLTESSARNCFLINQFATPGLGSLMVGRWLAGIPQLLLACAGFCMFVGWFILTMRETYSMSDFSYEPKSYAWLGGSGAIVFAAAWLWSLITSIQVIRAAKALKTKAPPPVPSA